MKTVPPPRRGRQSARQSVEVRGPATRRGRGQPGASHSGPQTAPATRPAPKAARLKSASQAQARAKARKAKAPRVVRPPLRVRLRERLLTRLAGLDLRPQALVARIPFVVLVIGALGVGLGVTLWLSTDAAQRSYQLGSARELNSALLQQKEALERDVLQAESAPALADAARNLGMIPSDDTAHLVLDPAGNWVVIGQPKPATGAPPPPLNTKLPDPTPPPPPTPTPGPGPRPGAGPEVPVRVGPGSGPSVPGSGTSVPGSEVPVLLGNPADRHAAGPGAPGSAPLPGPVQPELAPPGPAQPGIDVASPPGGLTLVPVDPTVGGETP